MLLKSVRCVTKHLVSQVCAPSSHCCPQATPPALRDAVARLTHELLTWWLSLHISLSPLGYLAQQHHSCSSYLICVCAPCDCQQTKASDVSCFFFYLPLTHNVCTHLSACAMAAGVSILSDLPYSMSEARIGEISREMETGKRAPQHKSNTRKAAGFICECFTKQQNRVLDLKELH